MGRLAGCVFALALLSIHLARAAETTDHLACGGSDAVMRSDCASAGGLRCAAQSLSLAGAGTSAAVPLIGRPAALGGARPGRGLDRYVYDWACADAGPTKALVLVYRCAEGIQGCQDADNRDDKDVTQFITLDGRDIAKGGPLSKGYWAVARRLGLAQVFEPPGLQMTTLSFVLPSEQGR